MNKTLRYTIRSLQLIVCGALTLTVSPANAASCERLVQMVEKAVPASVGDPAESRKLLAASSDAQLSRGFGLTAVEKAVHDELKEKVLCRDRTDKNLCGGNTPFTAYENPRTRSTLLVDLDQGRVLYANPERRFDASSGRNNEVSKPDAEKLALKAITELGVPRAEVGRVFTNALMSAAQDVERREKPSILRTEVNVRVQRQVQGVPVLGSDGRFAVGATGEIARMQLTWPDFRLAEGLSARRAASRASVMSELRQSIAADNKCGSISRVNSYVAYVPAGDVEGPGKADGTRDPGGFVPVLVAFVTPREPPENSGRVTEAEQQFAIPLFSFANED